MNVQLATYKVSLAGLSGSLVNSHFMPDVELIIKADRISKVRERVDEWLTENYLKVNTVTIRSISLLQED